MQLFSAQIDWRGIGTMVAIPVLVLLAVAFAAVAYTEWSSDAAITEFMNAIESSNEAPAQAQPLNGRTVCPLGKKPLPTQLIPLP